METRHGFVLGAVIVAVALAALALGMTLTRVTNTTYAHNGIASADLSALTFRPTTGGLAGFHSSAITLSRYALSTYSRWLGGPLAVYRVQSSNGNSIEILAPVGLNPGTRLTIASPGDDLRAQGVNKAAR